MTEVRLFWAFFLSRAETVREDPDRGEILSGLLWVAGFVVLALALLAVIIFKATNKANSIDLQ